MSVVSHINKLGGTRSPILVEWTQRMFAWCVGRRIRIEAQHLPGKANITADFLSRHLSDRTDWILNNIFRAINQTWGPLQVDLFATCVSTQLQQFFRSGGGSDGCFLPELVNSVGIRTPTLVFNCKGTDESTGGKSDSCAGHPLWETQPWFPAVVNMLVDPPILPNIPESRSVDPTSKLRLSSGRDSAPAGHMEGL